MRIYLDNNHIQELVKKQDSLLAEKLKSHQIELLFSFINFVEITQGIDNEKILVIADFLEKCKIIYLKKDELLFKRDLFNFLKKDKMDSDPLTLNFNECIDHSSNELPKLFDLIDCIKNNNIAELIRLSIKDEIFKRRELFDSESLDEWGKRNEGNRKKWGDEKYWKELDKLRINKLFELICQYSLDPKRDYSKVNDSFPGDFLSFSMAFFTQHIRHEQKGKKWLQNDLFDIQQCAAIPYVDYFITDKGNACASNEVKTRLEKNIPSLSEIEIVNSLENLECSLTGEVRIRV